MTRYPDFITVLIDIAHAVGLCKEFVAGDDFVVYLGDNLIQYGIKKYLDEFQNGEYDGYILLKEVEDLTRFEVAKLLQNRIQHYRRMVVRHREERRHTPSEQHNTG